MTPRQAFQDKYGQWALITGASAGIGAEFAIQLAERGMNLVLVARREAELNTLADQLHTRYNIKTKVVVADLTAPDFIDDIRTATQSIDIGLLVNNAGMVVQGEFLGNDLERELKTLDLNTRAPLILTHEFGQAMRERGRGGVIFVGSSAGYAPSPYMSNYAASKSQLLTFAEGIAYELKEHGVDVITVSPGPTQTDMLTQVTGTQEGMRGIPAMTAHDVVAQTLERLGKKTAFVPGWRNSLMTFVMTKILPRPLSRNVMGRMMKSLASA